MPSPTCPIRCLAESLLPPRALPIEPFPQTEPLPIFRQALSDVRSCSPEEALEAVAKGLQTHSQRFWSAVLSPGCEPLREHPREVVKDISRWRDSSEIKVSLICRRQRTPDSGFWGNQFRVHTSPALTPLEGLRGD